MGRKATPKRDIDPKFSSLLRAVIQKSNTQEQVAAAAKAVEEYVSQNENAAKELARISNTIVHSGKLSNYGTAEAQKTLKAWAEKYPVKDEMP